MSSVSTGSPALSQLRFCSSASIGLGFFCCFVFWFFFKAGWRLAGPRRSGPVPPAALGPAGRAARPALRPAAARGHTETAPRPPPRPTGRGQTIHPPREQTIRSGSRAWHEDKRRYLLSGELGHENTNCCSCPSLESCSLPARLGGFTPQIAVCCGLTEH